MALKYQVSSANYLMKDLLSLCVDVNAVEAGKVTANAILTTATLFSYPTYLMLKLHKLTLIVFVPMKDLISRYRSLKDNCDRM